MSSDLTGDFPDLAALEALLDAEQLRAAVLERAALRVGETAERQYAAGQGPEGEVWPVNTSNGRWPSLRRLTAGIEFRATDTGIAATGDNILQYHHDRSAKYAHLERRTFPPAGELSGPWARAAEDGAREALDEKLGAG